LWHEPQLAVVATCELFLPVAVEPLWQLAQLVAAVKIAWLTLAPAHEVFDL